MKKKEVKLVSFMSYSVRYINSTKYTIHIKHKHLLYVLFCYSYIFF